VAGYDVREPSVVATSVGARGEVVLRRRETVRRERGRTDTEGQAVDELIVNGAFAMDSTETSSERELASLAYCRGSAGGRMLVGGLGLGYTAQRALELDVGHLDVVEIEEALVRWAEEGRTGLLGLLAREPRLTLLTGDVAQVLTDADDGRWDAIALDVDNGPDFLIHAANASLYTPEFLRLAYQRLAPGGRLAIWCQGPSPGLLAFLTAIAVSAQEHLYRVQRGERRFSYAIYTLDRPAEAPTRPGQATDGEPE